MLKEIPIGCVQGSVLGPRLFHIYTSGLLSDIIGKEFFNIAYTDDFYIAISCGMKDYATAKEMLEKKLSSHFDWLKSLGMVVNATKTEFIIFHPCNLKLAWNDPLLLDGCKVFSFQDTKNSRNSFLSHSGLGNSYRHCDKQSKLVVICLPLFEFKTN
jgi:hypothetical protein